MSDLLNQKILPPTRQEQPFFNALYQIWTRHITKVADLQKLPLTHEQYEVTKLLLEALRDEGEDGFWDAYEDYLSCHDMPRLMDFLELIVLLTESASAHSGTPYNGTLLSTVEPESIEWLWKGYIPLGKLTIVEGDPGLGKSSILLDLAARVSSGAAMPDETIALPKASGVVLVMNEDGLADTIRPRLERVQADLTRIVSVSYIPSVDASTQTPYERPFILAEDLAVLERAVRSYNAKLVVIDPVMAVLGGKDTYKDNEVRSFLAPLVELSKRHNFACVLVRHLTKGSGDNPLYRGGGSIAFMGLARAAMMVVSDPNDSSKCILYPIKNNLSKLAPALSFSVTSDEATNDPRSYILWHGTSPHTLQDLMSPASTDKPGNLRQDILSILKERYPVALMVQEIQEAFPEVKANTLCVTLKRMVEDKQIEKSARGTYGAFSV
jgi:archaellum biogenesis ATPase FlaH